MALFWNKGMALALTLLIVAPYAYALEWFWKIFQPCEYDECCDDTWITRENIDGK